MVHALVFVAISLIFGKSADLKNSV